MNRSTLFLAAGVAAGVLLAGLGLLAPSTGLKPGADAGTAASINDVAIRMLDYQSALAALAADRHGGLTPEDRRRVLDRLIEEELLVQRALELDLPRHDGRLRADLVRAVVASVLAEAESRVPETAEVESFYREHQDFFARPGSLRVRQVFLRVAAGADPAAAMARGEGAARRLRAGEAIEALRQELGDREVAAVPDALLPAEKLVDYLGPTVLRQALALPAGAVSEPIRSGTGVHVVQVVERIPGRTPPLEEVRREVEVELRRRAGERALRDYLEELRERATIWITADLP